jgi:hypothetical protein
MGQLAGRCSSSTIPKRWWLARSRRELPSHRRLAMSTAGASGESSIHSARNRRSANLSARGRRPKPCFARKRGRRARLLCLGEREPVSPLMSCPRWTTSKCAIRPRAHSCFTLAEQLADEAVGRSWCSSHSGARALGGDYSSFYRGAGIAGEPVSNCEGATSPCAPVRGITARPDETAVGPLGR